MAITLDATTKTLELTTSAAVSTDWAVSWVDATTTAFTPGDSQGNVSTATTTTIVAAPAASTQRGVKSISVLNRGTSAQGITIKKDVSATEYILFQATLAAGESAQWVDGSEWATFDAAGRKRTSLPESLGYGGRTIPFFSTGTASDAAAYWYGYWKDAGFPGAWAPGTPGINGRVTDGMAAADVGCLPLWTPASGGLYLSNVNLSATVNHFFQLVDVVWVNSGIAVATTGPQAIVTPAFPARDLNGSSDGEGYMIGLYSTAANTNAAVINNSTVSYVNSDNTGGTRTATLVAVVGDQIPATPVIGTVVWFRLQAGDRGVRSISSISLGTSLATGSVSLFVGRPIATISPTVVNVGQQVSYPAPGVRLWTGTCALWFAKTSATTATTMNGSITVTER